jgi:hypothetical protein
VNIGSVNIGLDEYSRNARLKPALLTALPAALTVATWSSGGVTGWSGAWGLFVAAGGTWFLSQLARDRGKRKERELFEGNGGRPTELLLSHNHAPNKVTLAQRHAKLGRLMPQVPIPSVADEQNEPSRTREIYTAWVSYLISRTRDDRLLLQENISYGFRRNLWGLKPVGLVVSVGSAVVLGLQLFSDASLHIAVSSIDVVAQLVNVLAIVCWLFLVAPDWVLVPGRAYAERLMEALDRLAET